MAVAIGSSSEQEVSDKGSTSDEGRPCVSLHEDVPRMRIAG